MYAGGREDANRAPLDLPGPEDVVARIRDLGALFDKSPKDAREALKHLLDHGIQLHPLEGGRYRARWTVRGGAILFGGTTKPPVKTEGLEERSTLWVAGAGFASALCNLTWRSGR